MKKRVLIVGCGFTGASAARRLAENGFEITLIDQRSHVGGNSYDCKNGEGVWIHPYGPHIFFTDHEPVWKFLQPFSSWQDYRPQIKTKIDNVYLDMPFNLHTFKKLLPTERASKIVSHLQSTYSGRTDISILELLNSSIYEAREAAKLLYEKNYSPYNQKQWGLQPEELEDEVLFRMPIRLTFDKQFKKQKYQGYPTEGFTRLFYNMLSHPSIELRLNTPAKQLFKIQDNKIDWIENFSSVLYTGMLDELFQYVYGDLSYRMLDFKQVSDTCLPYLAVYYPEKAYPYTRKTDYRHLPQNTDMLSPAVIAEYPRPYKARQEQDTPFYVKLTKQSRKLYKKYQEKAQGIDGLWIAGRLADYRYYNMDDAAMRGLSMAEKIMQADRKE